jgi:hypothetical protein
VQCPDLSHLSHRSSCQLAFGEKWSITYKTANYDTYCVLLGRTATKLTKLDTKHTNPYETQQKLQKQQNRAETNKNKLKRSSTAENDKLSTI